VQDIVPPTSPIELFWYQATLEEGQSVLLSVQAQANASIGSPLAQAIALGSCDSLCQEVESILNNPLDFTPLSKAPGTEDYFGFSSNNCVGADARIYVDQSLWTTVSDKGQCGASLLFDNQKALLRLARIKISDDDSRKIEQGSFVLIPESFDENWLCTLLFPKFDSEIDVRFHAGKHKPLLIASNLSGASDNLASSSQSVGGSADPVDGQYAEIWLQEALMASPGMLLQHAVDDNGAVETQAEDQSKARTGTNKNPEITSNRAKAEHTIQLPQKLSDLDCLFKFDGHTYHSNLTQIGSGHGALLRTWT